MNGVSIQLVIAILGVAGGWVAAFYGAKISIARVEEKIAAQGRELAEVKERLGRLETPYFGRSR